MRRSLFLLSFVAMCLPAQQAIYPLASIRPDMEGVARTVFRGQDSEEFPLRILGVLSNSGPGQSVILARLLTPRLEQTGVMQGMSGSPVYIEGKLAGAIAFAFPFAKEPIAGIRPIEEMLAVNSGSSASRPVAVIHLGSTELIAQRQPLAEVPSFTEVLTPMSFAGFSANTIQHFASSWRDLGFVAQQGAAGNRPGAPSTPLKPGDMISVQLLGGDMTVGADGTLTHIDGKKLYAFGHRFMGAGAVEFPFSKAEVITPMPNLNLSFKISQGLHPAGAILFDNEVAVTGEIGRKVRLVPLKIRYRDANNVQKYEIEMVRHAVLSPLLLQMAIYSCIDRNFRSAGVGTVDIRGSIRYAGVKDPLIVEGRYAGDSNVPLAASLGAAIPFAFLQQQVIESILPESIDFDITAAPSRIQYAVERVTLSQRSVKPGETVAIQMLLATPDGKEQTLTHDFVIPAWMPGGETLTVTVADSFTTNLLDFRSFYQPGGPTFRSASEMIQTVNTLHPANTLFLRVLRTGAAYQSGAREFSNLPASVAAVMQKSPGAYQPTYQSRLAAREFRLAEGVVSGSRTVTLEVER